jgi:hypothetical protein
MANKLTEIFNALKTKDLEYQYDPKDLKPFILSIFLSYSKDIISDVQEMNKILYYVPDKCVWSYYMAKTPYKFFVPFPRKTVTEKYRSKRIDEIMEILDCGFNEAKDIAIQEEKLCII